MNLEERRAKLAELQRTARTISDPQMARQYLTKAAEQRRAIEELESAGGVTPDITKSASSTPKVASVPRSGVVADLAKAHVHYDEDDLLRELERLEKLADITETPNSARQWRAQADEVKAKVVEIRQAAGFTAPLRKMTVGGKVHYLSLIEEADAIDKTASSNPETAKHQRQRATQLREDVMLEKAARSARAERESAVLAPNVAQDRLNKAAAASARSREFEQRMAAQRAMQRPIGMPAAKAPVMPPESRAPNRVLTPTESRELYLKLADAATDREAARIYLDKAAELEDQVHTFDRFKASDEAMEKAVECDRLARVMSDHESRKAYADKAVEQRELARKLRREAIDKGARP